MKTDGLSEGASTLQTAHVQQPSQRRARQQSKDWEKRWEGAGNSARLSVFVCFSELKLLRGDWRDGNEHATNVFSSFHKTIFPPKKKEANGQMAQMVSASCFTNDCCSTAAAKYAQRLACSCLCFQCAARFD